MVAQSTSGNSINTKGLSNNIIIVLLLLAVLALADFFVINRQIKVNESFASIVNVSGRQRMLSHRAAFLCQAIVISGDRPRQQINELGRVISDLEVAHLSFTGGTYGELPHSVYEIFYTAPTELNKKMLGYIKLLKTFHKSVSTEGYPFEQSFAEISDIIQRGELPRSVEKVVYAYQFVSEKQITNLQLVSQVVLGTNFVALFILGFFLFRPMLQKLKSEIKKLTDSENYNRMIIDTAVDSIITIDEKGKVEVFNPAAENLFGYQKNEVMGQNVNVLMPSPHKEGHDGYLENYVKTGVAKIIGFGRELKAQKKSGEVFPIYLAISEITIGSERKFLGIIRDLTQQKDAEHKIKALNATLERKVVIRTQELANANINLEQENAERKRAEEKLLKFTLELKNSNQELEQFAYVASHDLQEPLRKILAFGSRLEKAEKEQLAPKSSNYLERMLNAAERMKALINDLLTYSRVSTQAQPFESVDLNELVRDVISYLEIAIESSQGTIEVAELAHIQGDPLQIRQLVQNFISNALKFHRTDVHPQIKIYGELTHQGRKDTYSLYIEDNGIGFDEKYLDRIFVPFQRLHGREDYKGTGIGLAICKKIVDRHNGILTAKSAPGHGATFIATLPVPQEKELNP